MNGKSITKAGEDCKQQDSALVHFMELSERFKMNAETIFGIRIIEDRCLPKGESYLFSSGSKPLRLT